MTENCSSETAMLAYIGNPFATRHIRPGAVPFLFAEGQTAAPLIDALSRYQWRGQIVGPHGTGKSTLLASLIPELQRVGRSVHLIVLVDRQRRLPPNALDELREQNQVLIVDGYEQLSWVARWQLKRRCRSIGCGLIVTAHRDMGLSTVYRTAADEQTARRVVEHLLARLGKPPLDASTVEAALRRHGGNVREMLFHLYDVYERRRPRDQA